MFFLFLWQWKMLCQGNCGRHCVYGAQLLPGHIWLKLRPATNVCVDCKHRGKEISPVPKGFHQRYSDAPTGDVYTSHLVWLASR